MHTSYRNNRVLLCIKIVPGLCKYSQLLIIYVAWSFISDTSFSPKFSIKAEAVGCLSVDLCLIPETALVLASLRRPWVHPGIYSIVISKLEDFYEADLRNID